MIFKAILSNKAKPGYGQVTIPFPIPDSEYDQTIGLLENMGIGCPTAQDCRVDGLDSTYPILNRLVTQSVNVDELDYLDKRLDSFCQDENEKFQASGLCFQLAWDGTSALGLAYPRMTRVGRYQPSGIFRNVLICSGSFLTGIWTTDPSPSAVAARSIFLTSAHVAPYSCD